jgi:cell wall-associated NlpC family hydrolase
LIESLVGHPYEGQFGCFLVVRKALEILGKHIPDYSLGLREIDRMAALLDGLKASAVPVDNPERGDVVLLRISGQPGHIGIMISPDEMLHCMRGVNAVIERVNSARWRGRVIGYWRP